MTRPLLLHYLKLNDGLFSHPMLLHTWSPHLSSGLTNLPTASWARVLYWQNHFHENPNPVSQQEPRIRFLYTEASKFFPQEVRYFMVHTVFIPSCSLQLYKRKHRENQILLCASHRSVILWTTIKNQKVVQRLSHRSKSPKTTTEDSYRKTRPLFTEFTFNFICKCTMLNPKRKTGVENASAFQLIMDAVI